MTSSHRIARRRVGVKARLDEDAAQVAGVTAAIEASNALLTTIDAVLDGMLATQGGMAIDAFGRQRVSNPQTLFDSKQIFDNQPLFWDDSEVSGGSTTSVHSVDRASSLMGVAATTAGLRVRQTFQRFNYQPGKCLLVLCTGILEALGGGTGIRTRIGYFDEENGLFFECLEGVLGVVQRSFVTGSAVDTRVAQSAWNVDKMDGTGASGITIDAAKAQLFFMDFEWLGVGDVRMGFIVDGVFVIAHQFSNANAIASVYMSKANLPVRYEIDNDGTGAASKLEHMCSTVIVDGGSDSLGLLHYKSTEGTHVGATSSGTIYAVVGLRLKATHLAEAVDLAAASIMNKSGQDFEWIVLLDPTVAGTFTYANIDNSAVQAAVGASANTVTSGTPMMGGFVKSSQSTGDATGALGNSLRLGSSIGGTPTEIVLCVRPLGANGQIEGALTWRERS